MKPKDKTDLTKSETKHFLSNLPRKGSTTYEKQVQLIQKVQDKKKVGGM